VPAAILTSLLALTTQAYAQDGYTSADLLERPVEAQNAHIQISVGMIGVVATQTRPEIARCVDDWFFGDDAIMAERTENIRSVMREHSSFHPAGVILAVVQQACGSFAE
jgi:hypothetical protein